MKRFIARTVRLLYVAVVLFCATYLAAHFIRQTQWNKDRLYSKLVHGSASEQLRAATALAQIGGEEQLLQALQEEHPSIHQLARRALEHVWFNAAGVEAYRLTEAAHRAAGQAEYAKALALLDQVTESFPTYAEGWNRRASVYWQLGKYEESRLACERVLALNPLHYGAWQGLGLCQLEFNDLAGACQSLRTALKILPHDDATQRCLRHCENLLRIFPNPTGQKKRMDLI